jgi:hypothetical protein
MSTTPVNQTLSGYWQQIPADTPATVRQPRRQTKIVCTLGPSSTAPDVILALARAGMDVARLNFSHGTHADHAARIQAVRDAAAESTGQSPCSPTCAAPRSACAASMRP